MVIGTNPRLRGNGFHPAIFGNFSAVMLENDVLALLRSYAGILNILRTCAGFVRSHLIYHSLDETLFSPQLRFKSQFAYSLLTDYEHSGTLTMTQLKERKIQTQIKHEILQEYLKKWHSIITSGLKNNYDRYPKLRLESRARFIYVDYFAFSGAYLQNGKTVYGSPVIGIEALNSLQSDFVARTGGLRPTINAILFEEVASTYNRLLTTLRSQPYGERIKETDDFLNLQDGEIAIVRGDSSQYVDQVLAFIDNNNPNPTYSFHFIDPYGTRAVERRNIEKIVSKSRADCMINMMVYPILLRLGVAVKEDLFPLNKLTQASSMNFLVLRYGERLHEMLNQVLLTVNRLNSSLSRLSRRFYLRQIQVYG